MSGGGNKSTTTQSNAPPKYAEPGLKFGAEQATALAKSGDLAKPLTMSTVVPFSQPTMQGMQSILGNASGAGADMAGQFGNIIGSGGFNDPQMAALQGIQNTATGSFDINSNPAFAQVRERAMDAARNAVNSQAAAMGRFGGGAHQGVLAREVGNVAADLDFNEYNNFQNRQQAAQRDLFNIGQQGMSNLPTAFENMMMPAQAQMGVGQQFEDLAGRQLNDQLRIADETQNAPRNNLRELAALLSGAGQFGTTRQTAQGPSNTMSNIAGGLLGGMSLLSGL